MKNENAINDYCQKICELYAKSHLNPYNSGLYAGKIGALWSFLLDALGRMTFSKRMYVLSKIDIHSSKHCVEMALAAIPDCTTLEHIRALWPFMPKSRKTERSILLRRAIEFAKNKDEIIVCLKEFGYF